MDLSTALAWALTGPPSGAAWAPWDKVIHVIGGRPPRYPMVSPPKTRKVHSYFLVFRRKGRGQAGGLDRDGGGSAAARGAELPEGLWTPGPGAEVGDR